MSSRIIFDSSGFKRVQASVGHRRWLYVLLFLFSLFNLCVVSVLAQSSRPANDDFSNRQLLTGSSVKIKADNAGATSQPGDPLPNPSLSASVWWTWTPPASGWAVLSVETG